MRCLKSVAQNCQGAGLPFPIRQTARCYFVFGFAAAELFAAGRERFGVERVAGGAESRIANVRFLSGTKTAGGGLHDAGLAVFNWEWTVLRMIVLG